MTAISRRENHRKEAEMQFEDIIYEKRDGIARVTINRPDKLNALLEKRKPDFGKFRK